MAASTGAATPTVPQVLIATSTDMSTALGVLLKRAPALKRKPSCSGVAVLKPCSAAPQSRHASEPVHVRFSTKPEHLCSPALRCLCQVDKPLLLLPSLLYTSLEASQQPPTSLILASTTGVPPSHSSST